MFNLSELKERHDRLVSENGGLLRVARPFFDRFLAELERLTEEATECGLGGIQLLKRVADEEGYLEVTLSLNDIALIIAADLRVALLEADDGDNPLDSRLATRALIYEVASNEQGANGPCADLVVEEMGQEDYRCCLRWITEEKVRLLAGGWMPVTRDASLRAAEALITFFYGLQWVWKKRPPLNAIRSGPRKAIVDFSLRS